MLCVAGVSAQAALDPAQAALDPAQVRQLAADDSSEKVVAIRQIVAAADPEAEHVRTAMADGNLYLADDKALIIDGEKAIDAATGAEVKMPAEPESVTVNNRIRGELANALATLKLFDADPDVRLASAQKLQNNVSVDLRSATFHPAVYAADGSITEARSVHKAYLIGARIPG